jgi:hypothetical protein
MQLEDFDRAIALKDAMDDLTALLEARALTVNGITLPTAHYNKLVKLIEVARDDIREQLRYLIGDRAFARNDKEAEPIAIELNL